MSIKCPRCRTNNPKAINQRRNGTFVPHLCCDCTIDIFGEVSSDNFEIHDLVCEEVEPE